jgi:RNase adaptor protein for sRNA GlmZ degradation
MENTAADVVDLSTMTEKQLAKEFKTVGKEIKSKEPEIKSIALKKLKDSRYFTIGGCLVPLIESMIPKKVCMKL